VAPGCLRWWSSICKPAPTFYAGQEDAALAHLKEHLSWRVQRGRDTCGGCGQTRGEDTPMLKCSGCRVAKFCSADHQKMASKKAALGGGLWTGGTRTSAECSASGSRLSKTVWRLTRALRAWWRFCRDECAMPDDSECVSAAVIADPSCLLSRALARSPISGDTT
jgi:hypothetical protein